MRCFAHILEGIEDLRASKEEERELRREDVDEEEEVDVGTARSRAADFLSETP